MDLRKLKTLIDLVQNSGISELEISEGEEKIRIAKYAANSAANTYVNVPVQTNAAVPANIGDGVPSAPTARTLTSTELCLSTLKLQKNSVQLLVITDPFNTQFQYPRRPTLRSFFPSTLRESPAAASQQYQFAVSSP